MKPSLLTSFWGIVGIVLLYFLLLWVGISEVVYTLTRVNLPLIVLAAAVHVVALLIRAYRWHFYVTFLGYDVPFRDSVRLTLFALSINLLSPGRIMGQPTKAVLFRKEQNATSGNAFAAVGMELFSDILCILFLVIMSFLFVVIFWDLPPVLLGGILLSIGLLFLLLGILAMPSFKWTVSFISKVAIGNLGVRINSFLKDYRNNSLRFFTQGILLKGFLISILSSLVEVLRFYIVLIAFNVEFSIYVPFAAHIIGSTLGMLSLIPFGLGVTEGSTIVLLNLKGMTKEVASAAVLLDRGIYIGFTLLLLYLSYLGRKFK